MLVWERFRRRVGEVCAGLMLVWEGFRRRSGWDLCRFDACMRTIKTQEWMRIVQLWCVYEKDSDAGLGEVCAGLMLVWEGFWRRSGWGFCRFDAHMRRIQAQEWLRILQFWCLNEKDSDARLGEFCAGLMLVWEGFRRKSGWGLCRFDACMRRNQKQEWERFLQAWCVYEKDSDAGVGEICAGLMLIWEGFRRKSGWEFCSFDACMRRIQTYVWVSFVQVWCLFEKDSDAGVGEVCAGLMLEWEAFRSRSERGLCRFDACMRSIQTQEWARFVQVWCKLEKDSDARVGEICAGLMLIWEGFRRRSERGVCRFGARMIKILTQEWASCVQFWCLNEKDSDARVVDVCAVLMLVWVGFRRTIGWGLCRFDACLRRIQTQEWVKFVQLWCLYEKNSEAGVGEVCAGLMQDEKDSDTGVGEVCAGLMLVWEGFRGTIGWGLCRFDAGLTRIQTQEWARFVQVWCLYEKNSVAGVGEIFAGLMQAWERFRRRSGWGLRRFDASMRRIQMQVWVR